MARCVGITLAKNASLFVCLETMVRSILGCADEELADILSLRVRSSSPDLLDELVKTDDLGEMLDQKDRAEYEKVCADRRLDETSKKEFGTSLATLRKKAREAASSSSAQKAKRGVAAPRRHRHSSFPAGDEISEAQANDMCPPNGRAFLDEYNGRWRVSLKGHKPISRSWGLHGFRSALMQCLRYVWLEHLRAAGLALSDCPVEGLFPSRPAPAQGSGAGSASSSGVA